jgi:hypothetical protein
MEAGEQMKVESMRYRALDVAHDALNGRQLLFEWIMHVKTHLLNGVGDVRTHEGEVLESLDKTSVLSQVGHRRADRGGEIRRCVNRCHGVLVGDTSQTYL